MNKVFLSGNLTRDAELRKTAGGTSVLEFSLAFTGWQKADDGSYKAHFIDCVLFGPRAERYAGLAKGQHIENLEGQLQQERWTDSDGRARTKVSVTVDRLEFKRPKPEEPVVSVYDEEIPF